MKNRKRDEKGRFVKREKNKLKKWEINRWELKRYNLK